MNKQELIEKWESKEAHAFKLIEPPLALTKHEMHVAGYGLAKIEILEDLKQLDEPKKVVVPRSVAEMIETYREKEISLAYLMRYFKGWYNKVNKGTMDSEDLVWIVNNLEEFLDAWIHGYEVEKEQLYKVVIDHKYLVQLFSGRTAARLVEYEELTNWHESAYKLTESAIKAIDERYWPFAVKA